MLGRPLPTDKSYLRTLKDNGDDGTPAAGRFEGWPDAAKGLRLIDPCCGSGHFLVAALALLTRFRMLEEGLSEAEAGDAVLRDNLHGLELDPRCTQLAAFNLALEAWKRGGYRTLPTPKVACSGISVGGQEAEWTALAGDDTRAARSLGRLYGMFKNAPDLGSLIDPARLGEDDPLYSARFDEVEALLDKALARTKSEDDPAAAVFGEAARGVTNAARLLRGSYHLVITNVPYLARGKQGDTLRDHLERVYPRAKADLATAFVERCRDYCTPSGTYALVTPQNWLFLGSYKKLREDLLKTQSWGTIARLGPKGFQTPMWDFNVMLFNIVNKKPAPDHTMTGLDVSAYKTPVQKEGGLLEDEVKGLEQAGQLKNPDAAIVASEVSNLTLLSHYAGGLQGISSADFPQFGRNFWELEKLTHEWKLQQTAPKTDAVYSGREFVLWLSKLRIEQKNVGAYIRGEPAWGKQGVAIAQMASLKATPYTGQPTTDTVAIILPRNPEHLCAVWTFCSSHNYFAEVRNLNTKVNLNSGYLVKVSFDLEHWQKVAAEQYPNGLPEPYSNDPTQWLFNGGVMQSTQPLQVAVAQLLGYAWPEQGKSTDAHPFPASETDLSSFMDEDGIVCLHPSGFERGAAERLRALGARLR